MADQPKSSPPLKKQTFIYIWGHTYIYHDLYTEVQGQPMGVESILYEFQGQNLSRQPVKTG